MKPIESDFPLMKISGPAERAVHAYYDLCPESPDGRMVTYCALDRTLDRGWVMTAGKDGTGHLRIGRSEAVHNHCGAFQQWGGGTNWLLYQEASEPSYVSVVVNVYSDTRKRIPAPVRMAHPRLPVALGHKEGPGSILPTGKVRDPAVVYASDLESGEVTALVRFSEVCACHPLGRKLAEAGNLHAKHTKWSPDGERFLFVISNEPYDPTGRDPRIKSLLVCDREGRNVKYVHEFGHHPMWMPDSGSIYAYEPVGPERQILRLFPLSGGRTLEREIDMPRGVHASISPNARWMVTDAFLAERGTVYLLDPAAGRQRRLVQFPCTDFSHATGVHPHPVWSRDGRRIYINVPLEGSVALVAVELGDDPWRV